MPHYKVAYKITQGSLGNVEPDMSSNFCKLHGNTHEPCPECWVFINDELRREREQNSNVKIIDSEGNTINWFTIEELFALTRLLEHEFTSYDDEEIIKVLDKIFNLVNEYKRKNGMVG